MIERVVLQTRKTADGSITALVNRGEEWSPRLLTDAVADIRSGRVRYVVPWPGRTVEVTVATTEAASLDAERPDGHPTGGLNLLPSG